MFTVNFYGAKKGCEGISFVKDVKIFETDQKTIYIVFEEDEEFMDWLQFVQSDIKFFDYDDESSKKRLLGCWISIDNVSTKIYS